MLEFEINNDVTIVVSKQPYAARELEILSLVLAVLEALCLTLGKDIE